ncbi:MAG: polyprenyl synthetase family protein [Planctomycetota bacterium]
MTPSAGLEQSYELVKPQLAELDHLLAEHFRSDTPHVHDMLSYARKYSGKRLRPALVFLIGHICGGADEGHVKLGAVVEMIHLATLVHDDVLDRATMRRNAASVNAAWNDKDAILLGDIIFARAIRLLVSIGSPRAIDRLTGAVSLLCEGEIHQNQLCGDPTVDEATYESIIQRKTAALYSAGCEAAAELGGADEKTVQAFSDFGMSLGTAFQVIDDCLDVSGDEAVVGKSLGSDVVNGKMTLPLIRLLGSLDAERRAKVEATIRATNPSVEDRGEITQWLQETGALESSFARAEEMIEDSLAAVRKCVDPAWGAVLGEIAGFVLKRRR